MPEKDAFAHLARYYDPIMAHVNYDRWFATAIALAEMLPSGFRHLDAGCGTGVLVSMLRNAGWGSIGIDLSTAMIESGRRTRGQLPLATADIRALPFKKNLDLITCLFDSINFLLEEQEVARSMKEFAEALRPGGLLYFDIVTERMVTVHFAGQEWNEDNGGFRSTWSSAYDQKTACAETKVRINTGDVSYIRERIYPHKLIEGHLRDAGLTTLAVFDAETWRSPTRHTTRIDFVAMKEPPKKVEARFRKVAEEIRTIVTNQVMP